MQATAEEDKSKLLALHNRRVSCALGNAGALLLCQVSQPFAGVGFEGGRAARVPSCVCSEFQILLQPQTLEPGCNVNVLLAQFLAGI
jgi:hypothetical protein